METIIAVKSWLVWGAVGVMVLMFVVAMTWNSVRDQWQKASPLARCVCLLAIAGATMFGGAKSRLGSISFPYTDVEQKYIIDAGSYVTNDYVHVAFTRIIAPPSADLVVMRRALDMTNDTDWVTHMTTTFAEFNQPRDISFLAATNWNWQVFTTWTPGAAVQTNGVWHAYWGLDRKARVMMIPARTCIRVDGSVIATPKSVWDSTNAVNSVGGNAE